ncbi:type II secretion system F family protein [Noviherbaspirillum galbum]|uniref:Type II secretion system F family protein n=1 Tax=Noviherbaspirillum galbum TaxID=2709383 RepID=A0A6B3SNZ0_9BURK|nr:type II secretion system F family protein [Noviherbaspirillum galbum]NEX62453.1 type II secretion system F family protein [Noviherbaspirillum galbum]
MQNVIDALPSRISLILALAAACAGIAAALAAWLLGKGLSSMPREDRSYKDPPPLGFRLAWWPIRCLSHAIVPMLESRPVAPRIAAMRARLCQAGLDYSLDPAQFVAARLVSGMAVAAIAWWIAASLSQARNLGEGAGLANCLKAALPGFLCGWAYPGLWLRDRLAVRRRDVLKSLPFYLDIITLCVEAGLNMQGAMQQAVAKGPPGMLRAEFQRVQRDIRAGRARADALREMADRLNEAGVRNFVSAVIQAERMGMNLGPVLRAQADQRRAERFMRAEKLAMEAPVKMLLPLIAFIFPCTFVVLFFPIVMKFLHSGF